MTINARAREDLSSKWLGSSALELRAWEKETEAPRYDLTIERLPQDRNRIAAGETSIEGEQLPQKRTAEDSKPAIEKYMQALKGFRDLGDRSGEAQTLHNLARVYEGLYEYQTALDYLSQALQLRQALGDRRGEAETLGVIDWLYELLGQYQKSLDILGQGLVAWRNLGDRSGEARVLTRIGRIYHRLGDGQKALEFLRQALPLHRALGDRRWEARTLSYLGSAYRGLGEPLMAVEFLRQAIPLREAIGDRSGKAVTSHSLGVVYTNLGEYQKALDFLGQALAIRKDLGQLHNEALTLAVIALAESGLGNLHQARVHIEAAIAISESLRTLVANTDELRASYFAMRPYYQVYIELLMKLHEKEPLAQHDRAALEASERARARSLLDLLTEAKVDLSHGIDPALKQKEKEIQASISRLNDRLMQTLGGRSPDKDLVAQLKEELKQTENLRERTEADIRKKHPKYAELKYPIPLKLEAIQGLLDEHTALLEYSLGKDRSFLFVVSKEGLRSYRLPPAAEINQLVQEVRSALQRPGRRELGRYLSAARRLFDILVGPATSDVQEKRQLLVAPDGALYYLPFEALLTAQSNTADQLELAYLIKRWAVSYVPSASVLANLRQSQPATDYKMSGQVRKEFLAFADPIYRAHQQGSPAPENKVGQIVRSIFDQEDRLDLRELKDSSREVAGIAKFYRPETTAIYLGEAATEESVKSNQYLTSARRIHFATHGLISERMPQHSGLVLTLDEDVQEDGLLQVYEIFNLKLSADLVVLSACRTGLGKEVRGEGVIGLTRAFMYAGASSLTVSLWQVADQSTSELMIHFYEQMNAGNVKTEALRRAKLKMIADRRYAHPYYWAPFVLTGEPK